MGKNNKKYTLDEVRIIVGDKGFELVSEEYVNSHTKLTLKDNEGYYYQTTIDNLNGNKIPRFVGKSNNYSIMNIHLWIKLNNKQFKILSNEYHGNKTNLKWLCLKDGCGEIFEASWHTIDRGDNCPFCAGKQVGLSNCLNIIHPNLANEFHPTLNGILTSFNITHGSNKKVWWQCGKNPKHIWSSTIINRVNGNGCPYCAGQLPNEDYNLLIANPELCKEWDYNKNKKKPEEFCPNSNKQVYWKCKECGYEWQANICDRNKGKGCSKCYKPSKGEIKIDKYFSNINIYYKCQYKFNDCRNILPLKFDFYLPDYIMAIEFNGKQHYESIKHFGGEEQFKLQQKLDRIKRDYCKLNNIILIVIPYWDYDNIEQILQKKLNIHTINNSNLTVVF